MCSFWLLRELTASKRSHTQATGRQARARSMTSSYPLYLQIALTRRCAVISFSASHAKGLVFLPSLASYLFEVEGIQQG